ncbi:hypothetical protein L208DRAFT_908981 [Tricholoma matsutake]|nr:hypothetical protein L208DRAFT_908981 [Tricholoma matsutake 945]
MIFPVFVQHPLFTLTTGRKFSLTPPSILIYLLYILSSCEYQKLIQVRRCPWGMIL